ncbi:hypothetical protein RRG08_039153 [Elysia crispata]|uniref:Uncharacterized protein n=1 Tax=Elysia crispata TaxID=231223 RepID=A0AAE1AGX2_9GAST|nr:hypothetical protein RRG08_039153 [Elysia crispata]
MLASKHEISQHTARRRSILTRECRLLIETVLSFTPGLTLDDPGRKAWAVRQRAEPGLDHDTRENVGDLPRKKNKN